MLIKRIFLVFFLVFTTFMSVNVISQGAPSMWYTPTNDGTRGDIIHRTVLIPYDTLYTYYSSINWNAGQDGGGYLGLQAHPHGHNFIFSIWDPSNHQAISAPYSYPGTQVTRFGGEGTGLKTMNYTIGWSNNQWVTTTVRRWDHNNHTRFGFWVKKNNTWYHVATLNFPMPNITLSSSNGAFLEDWNGTGQNKRKFYIGNSWKRQLNGQWLSHSNVNLTANPSQNSIYDNNFNGGLEGNAFFLESGGNSSRNRQWYIGNDRHLNVTRAFTATPSDAVIDFTITNLSTNSINWNVPTSSVPQFKQTIKINGSLVASTIAPERSSASITASPGDTVELILEDILGRTRGYSQTIDGCNPSAITPYVFVNRGGWQQTPNVTLAAGGSILFGPQAASGGYWSWSGPNGFSASTRETTVSNLQASGNYIATYTNNCGISSTQTFTITVTSKTASTQMFNSIDTPTTIISNDSQ